MRQMRGWFGMCLIVAALGCAQAVSVKFDSPPSPGAGEACTPSQATGQATTSDGMSKMSDPPDSAGCVAKWSCGQDPCKFVMPSLSTYKDQTVLSFECDLQSNDSTGTPASTGTSPAPAPIPGTPMPGYNSAELCLEPSKYWGRAGQEQRWCQTFYLAGHHYRRISKMAAVSVPAGTSLSGLTATITMRKDTKVGTVCGWREIK